MDLLAINQGWLIENEWIQHIPSPNFNQRPSPVVIDLLVLHNISLPLNQFNNNAVIDFFTNQLSTGQYPELAELKDIRVSAHCFIRRDGQTIQFVNFNDRAWHAGASHYQQRANCNDFSIGIELEGSDYQHFTEVQYLKLKQISLALLNYYPALLPSRIVGHSDIAPKRKTDPGTFFDWWRYFKDIE